MDDQKPECADSLQELYSFLDGELTPDRRVHIKEHLDHCLPCYEAFDFEAELRVVIAQRCRDEVPDGPRDRIAQAIQHESLLDD